MFISSEYRAKLYTRLEDKRVKKLKREQRKAETKDKYADTPEENKVLGWLKQTFRTHARSCQLKRKDMHRMHLDVDIMVYKYSLRER